MVRVLHALSGWTGWFSYAKNFKDFALIAGPFPFGSRPTSCSGKPSFSGKGKEDISTYGHEGRLPEHITCVEEPGNEWKVSTMYIQ